MSSLTSTQVSKAFPSSTQLISTIFIILFTLVFLLNFSLTSNPLYSTWVNSHLSPLANSITPTPNTSTVAIENDPGYVAASLFWGTNVENGSSSTSPPPRSSCDMFDGSWVYDESAPVYPPGSCPHIGDSFNCFKSGRPDFGFLNYRWQPYGCDIPRFDGKRMMEMLRGKRMVFVGDSLNRNMYESLICSLGVHGTKHSTRDGLSFEIKDYECSITVITAPFLVKQQKNSGPDAKNNPISKLRIDQIHDSVAKYYNADFLIFNTGQWWGPGKTHNGENFFQEGDDFIHKKLDLEVAYTKSLTTWGNWIDTSVNHNKTKVFFVGITTVHYKGGEWFTNGTCDKGKEPIKDTEQIRGQVLEPYRPWIKTIPELVMSKMKTQVIYLNISHLTDYRKDGHPSKYRRRGSQFQPGVSQDCMHWCLPGVPDSWNQLLYASLVSSEGQV